VRQLRAPRQDGQVLIDPPLTNEVQWLERNVQRRRALHSDVHGRSLAQLAGQARAGLLDIARQYTGRYRDLPAQPEDPEAPLLLVGHQPELVHAGVWFKNFVLSELARRTGGHAVHVLCDNDVAETPAIAVPTGSARQPAVASVALDRAEQPVAHEQRRVLDTELFRSFGQRVQRAIAPLIAHPLIESWWPSAVAALKDTDRLGLAVAQARHQLEGRWGLSTLEVPLSAVCCLPACRHFTSHVLEQASQFRQVHNELLHEYRRVHHIRSHTHPVPGLAERDGWVETPFWLWSAHDPTRRAAHVRRGPGGLELTDRAGFRKTLPIAQDGSLTRAVQQLGQWEAEGIRLRPRALMTTMICRLLLGDVFIHGIGGAKYDELTDAIVRRFFGVEPPEFLVVSLTAMLPIQREQVEPADVRSLDQLLRDMRFHPELHVEEDNQTRPLIAEKARLLSSMPPPGQRRQWHQQMEEVNDTINGYLDHRRRQLRAERDGLARALRYNQILRSREYPFCLFPEDDLRQRLLDLSGQEL
jgi:hypothetical protein